MTDRDAKTSAMPARFFWIAIGYLGLLVGIFLLYQVSPNALEPLPDAFGPLPLGVPWFGALGGALVSLSGVFEYNRRWDPRFDYWHYSRPLVAGVIGSVGALLFYVVVQTANSGQAHDLNLLVFDSVAFLVGYREQTFRLLIKRVTDLLLGGDGLAFGPSAERVERRQPR